MARLLVAALVLAEIASFVIVGQWAGVLGTLLLVVLASLLGVALLRRQGGEALAQMRGTLRTGRDPRPALLRGGFRLVAALLLIVPGFLGDVVALLLLLPPVQRALAKRFARQGAPIVALRTESFTAPAPPEARPPRDRGVDAEWEETPPHQRPPHRPSGWTRH